MPLDPEQLVQAQRQVAEGHLTLWNARLTALLESGQTSEALAVLREPLVRLHGDNCNCSCGAEAGLAAARSSPE